MRSEGDRFPGVPESPPLPRPHYLLVGLAGHLLAIAPMVYLVGFLTPWPLPRTVDGGALFPAGAAVAVDLALLASFAVVHSLLARDAAKRALARVLPPELERSVYSIVAGLQIVALLALWRALPDPVWRIEAPAARAALWGAYAAGWAVVVASLAAVSSTHLFGLGRAWAAARGLPYREPPISARGPYRYVRHPLYSATTVALFATPEMSVGHLLLAVVFTAYMLIGMRFEERDLERKFGSSWREYKAAVPALIPRFRSGARG
jgi:protein-S-isoprenylcysteine O-methyltransferase Ste14